MSSRDTGTDRFELLHGDCLERMKEIEPGSVDMVLTDPPYGTTACKWDAVIPFEPMWEGIKRVIKKNGAIVMTASQPFTSALVMSNVKMFKYTWVWEKSTKTNFLNAKHQPLRKHEDVLVFSDGKTTYNPQGLQDKNSFTRQGSKETDNYGAQDRSAGGYFQEKTGYPDSVLSIKSHASKESVHPTQKPVALMEYLIRTYTNEGQTVLDFTMGSGTTGVACMNTGRNFIGIEMDADYFDIAASRIAEAYLAALTAIETREGAL